MAIAASHPHPLEGSMNGNGGHNRGQPETRGRRFTNVLRSVIVDRFRAKRKDTILDLLSLESIKDDKEEMSKPWYTRTGMKRKGIALSIVVFLLLATTFLLRKEVKLEAKTAAIASGQKSNRRQIVGVIAVETMLLSANGFAAYRVVKISRAIRNSSVAGVISKTKTVIRVITHPPPVLRPIMAPFQLALKGAKPIFRTVHRVQEALKRRAVRMALKLEERRHLFVNDINEATGRIGEALYHGSNI